MLKRAASAYHNDLNNRSASMKYPELIFQTPYSEPSGAPAKRKERSHSRHREVTDMSSRDMKTKLTNWSNFEQVFLLRYLSQTFVAITIRQLTHSTYGGDAATHVAQKIPHNTWKYTFHFIS